jgi:hypothetical protein
MAVKFYDRKTKKFYIRKPKLIHIGIKNIKSKEKLTDDDKYKIARFADKVEYFGTEFGTKTIVSISHYDIFRIRDEIKKDTKFINKKNIERIKSKKYSSCNIDIIKKQLGL